MRTRRKRSSEVASQQVLAEERIYTASQWKLMLRRFRKHRAAIVGTVIVGLLYIMAIFAGFLAPYDPHDYSTEHPYQPPQRIRLRQPDGTFGLYVYGFTASRDPESFRKIYVIDEEKVFPVRFFVHSWEYKFWGLFATDVHLFGAEGGRAMLFGADEFGRDVFSKIIFGARISMSIGLIGIALSFVVGLLIGGISGYYGGVIDNVIQRVIEILRSFPTIPLWMALTASFPREWSPVTVYFMITIILSLIGWTGLARVVRGKFLALREEDYTTAVKLVGGSQLYIIRKHFIPSFMSHIIASITLAIPGMIIGETSLSFLGIGLRPPVVSWGVLLQEAQNVRSVAQHPWLLLPAIFIILAVLSFNFVGDGLRDAADPYGKRGW